MNNITSLDISDLGEYAKVRLVNRLTRLNIISRNMIETAVTELMMLLSIVADNRNEYHLSNKMNLIWQQAILDTLFYKYFCLHSCIKYNSLNKILIHYEPEQTLSRENILIQQLKTIAKFNVLFGRYPTRELWGEVIRNMSRMPHNNFNNMDDIVIRITTSLQNLNNNSENINFTDYQISVVKIDATNYNISLSKDKTLKDLLDEIIKKENIDIENLKIVYNGHIISSDNETLLSSLFLNNKTPKLHIFTRN